MAGAGMLGLAIIFWDTIPTYFVHSKLCKTEAGLKVYQTPNDWAEKHPAEFLELKENSEGKLHSKNSTSEYVGYEQVYKYLLGRYFVLETRITNGFNYAYNNRRVKESLIYKPTGQVMFEVTDFFGFAGSRSIAVDGGSFNDYKIWTATGSCERSGGAAEKFYNDGRSFSDLMKIIYGWSAK